MTLLLRPSPLRLSAARDEHGVPLVVQLEPLAIVLRPKGTRRALRVSLERVWLLAAQIEAEALREKRPERRNVRRGALAGM
jgi:hypothetical protein